MFILFIYFYISVTRSLTRALKLKGITLDIIQNLLQPIPKPIIDRRITVADISRPAPGPPPSPRRRTITGQVQQQQPQQQQPQIQQHIWCVCLRPSFGTMIQCDNNNCKIKWYHLTCINMLVPPEGEWFCAYCAK